MATVQCYIVAWDAFLNQIPILSTPLLPYTYSYSHSHSYSPTLYFVLCTLYFVLCTLYFDEEEKMMPWGGSLDCLEESSGGGM